MVAAVARELGCGLPATSLSKAQGEDGFAGAVAPEQAVPRGRSHSLGEEETRMDLNDLVWAVGAWAAMLSVPVLVALAPF
jgi:hypothetical protein